MQNNTLIQLQKISVLKQFKKDEYICYEGQPGDDMYIILSGNVGIFLTNAIGTLNEIARIGKGDFFGEMSLFDRLPRSASCIALEDTICVAINKSNIRQFLANCPDLVEKILANMSMRIRDLDHELHNVLNSMCQSSIYPFSIPDEYEKSHYLDKPFQAPEYLANYKQACPVCGAEISAVQVRRNILAIQDVDTDGRIRYSSCDPLWHDIVGCPYCNYSNHYLNFFNINPAVRNQVKNILEELKDTVEEFRKTHKSLFDRMILRYLQAIYINERINAADNVMIGTLWLSLYWLSRDVKDDTFAGYCAQHAADKLAEAIDKKEILDEKSKCLIALSVSGLLIYLGREKEAWAYCSIAEKSPDEKIRQCVRQVKTSMVK